MSAGDQACLSFPPDLLRFLEADLGGGLKMGAGFAPRWIVPLTAAASVSYYLASPRGHESLNSWRATRARLVWTRPCADGETVEAHARIVRMGRASMRFHWTIESAARHDLLAEGDIIFVSRDGMGAKPPVRRLHETEAAPPGSAAVAERATAAPPSGPDPGRAEVYYVAERCAALARERATTADDLRSAARALFVPGRDEDPWTESATCPSASAGELCASLERRLADVGGDGVRIVCAPGGGDRALLLRYVRALHPRVRVASATEAVLAFLDRYSPRALAIALPASHRRGDGLLWRHPVRILGRDLPITSAHAHPVALAAPWWEPGDVAEMAVLLDGAMVVRRTPESDGPPTIAFLAERLSGYELRIEVHPAALARASRRDPEPAGEAEAARFVEWPADPVEALAAFEAPFLIDACRAQASVISPGDSWTWAYPASLLRLLYHPIGGGAQPLGRRAHPLGAIAAAAAVHAAGEALGAGWTPREIGVRWRRPIDPLAGFLVRARACRCDAAEIEMTCRLEQPEAALADVSLILRAGGGPA